MEGIMVTAAPVTLRYEIAHANEMSIEQLNAEVTAMVDETMLIFMEFGCDVGKPKYQLEGWSDRVLLRLEMDCELPLDWTDEKTEQLKAHLNHNAVS